MAKQNKKGAGKKATPKAKKKTAAPSNSPFVKGFWKENMVQGLILLLIPFVLYGSTATFGYVLDDKIVLTDNQFVKKGFDGIGDIFSTESFTGFLGEQQDLVEGARYRPLSIATFAAEYAIFGENPAVSHLINVLFYALTGLLLYRVLLLIVPPKKDRAWYLTVAFGAALLWALHPIHTEVVANIKGRDEILAMLFSLATLYYVYKYLIEKKPFSMAMACAAFFIGILAKENTLTFLGVIPLALLLFTRIPQKRFWNIMLPLGGVTVLYLLIRVDVIGYLLGSGKEVTALMNNPFVEASSSEKFATITYTLGRYFGLNLFPHPLTHDYYPYHIPILGWGDWRVLVSLLLHLGLVAFAILRWQKNRVLVFCIGFYLMTLFITSNIPFTVGTFMNERFLFMPSAAFMLALSYLLLRKLPDWLSQVASAKQIGLGVVALFCVGFTVKTFARVPAWESNHSLNEAAIEVSVNSARANQYYAYSKYERYLEEKAKEAPDRAYQKELLEEAYPYVNKALDIHPTYSDALTCKGGILGGFYDLDKDIDRVLGGFYEIATAPRQVPFTETYLSWLGRRGKHYEELVDFYHRLGFEYWWQQKQDATLARKFINMGLAVVQGHPQLTADLAQVK